MRLIMYLTGAMALTVTAYSTTTLSQEVAKKKADTASVEISKVYREYLKAAIDQDKKAMERLLAEDYTLIDDKGRVKDRNQVLEQLTSPSVKLTSITPSELKIRVYGKSAVLTMICTEKGTARGIDFSVRARYTSVLVNQDERWRIVAEHATTVRE